MDPVLAQLHALLEGISYPTTRDELIQLAREHGAGEDVLHRLANMEPGTYQDPDEVSAAYTFLGETGTGYGHVTVYDQ